MTPNPSLNRTLGIIPLTSFVIETATPKRIAKDKVVAMTSATCARPAARKLLGMTQATATDPPIAI